MPGKQSSRRKAEERLLRAVEESVLQLQQVAEEVRQVAGSMHFLSTGKVIHLDGIANRLDAVAAMLGQELMIGPEPWLVRGLVGLARALLPAIGVVVVGMGEAGGADVYASLRGKNDAAVEALDRLENVIEQLAEAVPDDSVDEVREVEPSNAGDGFSGSEAATIVGITHRQLDYWALTALSGPSLWDERPNGNLRRRYSYHDLIELKVIKTLLDGGQKLERVRSAFDFLRDLGDDLRSARLVIAHDSVVLARDEGELLEVFDRHQGEGVLSVLAVESVVEQVDAAIGDRVPTAAGSDEP